MLRQLVIRAPLPEGELAAYFGVVPGTFKQWVDGPDAPTFSARRLIWFIWCSVLHPEYLKGEDAWLRWDGVLETEAQARATATMAKYESSLAVECDGMEVAELGP